MKATELIEELQDLVKEEGDRHIYLWRNDKPELTEYIRFKTYSDDWSRLVPVIESFGRGLADEDE